MAALDLTVATVNQLKCSSDALPLLATPVWSCECIHLMLVTLWGTRQSPQALPSRLQC